MNASGTLQPFPASLADSCKHDVTARSALKGCAGFIGLSPAMDKVYSAIARMAPSHAPVFITGESGTGKEVCAQAVHDLSSRKKSKFITLNCSAIPRDLMESEIFGHVRGAFTGALEDRTGAAELADGGTLFLDELCEMDLGLQAKLLRLIQSGEVQRVGARQSTKVNVRFVCATNRDPYQEIAAGRFREDLFYRLHVLPVHLPPLRVRGDDIMELAQHFLVRCAEEEGRQFHGFDALAMRMMQAYGWPGNVRQLQNVVRRIVVLNDGERVTADMLPEEVTRCVLGRTLEGAEQPIPVQRGGIIPLWMQEQRIIEEAIELCGGNTAKAAAALQISPSTIYRKKAGWEMAEKSLQELQ